MNEISPSAESTKVLDQAVIDQLKEMFAGISHDIPVYLFSRKDENEIEVQVGREILSAFASVSKRIKFKEYNLSHKQAKKWGVSQSPTIVFAPELYRIHYLGIPLGEEGRTLVETLMLVGSRASRVNEQTQRVLARIDSPRKLRVFVSPTCPYCPQQAVNAVKAAIERPDQVSLEIIDNSFNPELAEQYSAMSVPQTFANNVLIAKGAQSEELFAASLENMTEQKFFIPESDAEQIETDLVIIGGGPAGLTAAIYAARSGLNTVVLEKDTLGGQVATTPIVDNYPGLAHIGGKNLVDIMVAHALEYVNVFPREEVMEVKPGEIFELTSSLRRFTARAILLATGATTRKLGIPGESRFSGRGVSYCSTCDGPLFKDKKVVMVGGGNSAVTEAIHLNHIGADVTLMHRRDSLRAQDNLIQALEHSKTPIIWNTEVKEIKGQETVSELVIYNNQTDKTESFPTDGIFISVGYIPEIELAQKIGVEIGPDGYITHDAHHRTNIPGIYSAGDVEGGYKQIVTAAGAGAAAAMTLFEDLSHPYWKDRD
jgi:thioredoxin reductase (NADPH)